MNLQAHWQCSQKTGIVFKSPTGENLANLTQNLIEIDIFVHDPETCGQLFAPARTYTPAAFITGETGRDLIPLTAAETRRLAGGIPVDLRDTITGLDDADIALLLTAIRHASGKRPENSGYR